MSSYNKGMNNESNKCGNCGTTCSSCGRPWAICKQEGGCGCNKCADIKFCEYGRKACGCIREKQPGCPMQAAIPSVTVDSITSIKGLADCFVHVADTNTTYYIDDKHRLMITWAGVVNVSNYDFETNPLNLRNQLVVDSAANKAGIYDAQGELYFFPIGEEHDYNILNNKPIINDVVLEGDLTLADLGIESITNEEIDEILAEEE